MSQIEYFYKLCTSVGKMRASYQIFFFFLILFWNPFFVHSEAKNIYKILCTFWVGLYYEFSIAWVNENYKENYKSYKISTCTLILRVYHLIKGGHIMLLKVNIRNSFLVFKCCWDPKWCFRWNMNMYKLATGLKSMSK